MTFASNLRNKKIYDKLNSSTGDSTAENLLFQFDGSEEPQVHFLASVISRSDPDLVIEVGTGKSLFGLVLSEYLTTPAKLITFDDNPYSATAVGILNRNQDLVDGYFHDGDSYYIYPRRARHIQKLMRSEPSAMAIVEDADDRAKLKGALEQTAKLHISPIFVNDYYRSKDVKFTVGWFAKTYKYKIKENPYEGDNRGIILLTNNV